VIVFGFLLLITIALMAHYGNGRYARDPGPAHPARRCAGACSRPHCDHCGGQLERL
jgi:hypothetical protein